MNLPDKTLNIILALLQHLPQTGDEHLNRTISEANELLNRYSPNPNKIFELGKYTDFEMALAQETINRQLHFKIGTLKSTIEELEYSIKQLKEENKQQTSKLNTWSNLKKGERKELLKEKEIANLEARVEKLQNENQKLKDQHEKLVEKLIKARINL